MNAYDRFKLKNYVNTTVVGQVEGQQFYLSDIVLAAEFAMLNIICKGKKSAGKTQLMRDVLNGHYAGEEKGLWEMGRADFKPRDLYERFNISVAKGHHNPLPAIKTVHSSQGIKYLVESYEPQDGEGNFKLNWREITPDQANEIIVSNSLTTDDLVQLTNLNKHFFCIDEYNRCPEVIMNLFYGMMTGEITHRGKIHKLGGGYYGGIAAINPESYDGTFKMDDAMWARFHIAIDVSAFPISVADKDLLNLRNLSPNIHDSEIVDLTPEIFAAYERIKSQTPNLTERIILQYFQTALDVCTLKDTTKEHLTWPKICSSENCAKMSKLCGGLKGLDARAIRSVYRLAKGIEEVHKLKTGQEATINPIESFLLAYKFVAPYKGVINPKDIKEAEGLEALVLNQKLPAIKDELGDIITKFEELNTTRKNVQGAIFKRGSLNYFKTQFKNLGKADDYAAIVSKIDKEYTTIKKLSVDEIRQQLPELYEQLIKSQLEQLLNGNFDRYELKVLDLIPPGSPTHQKMLTIKAGGSDDNLKRYYHQLIDDLFNKIFSSYNSGEIIRQFKVTAEEQDTINQEITAECKEEISFIPNNKMAACKKEKLDTLNNCLKVIIRDKFMKNSEKLFAGERKFLEFYFNEAEEWL